MTKTINGIATFLPDRSVDNIEQAKSFGRDEAFVRSKLGALKLPRIAPGDEASDLAVGAVERLFQEHGELERDSLDAIVFVTQNPDNAGLPHAAAILQAKLGLPDTVACFDVGLGCSGYVYGLYILKGFLDAAGLHNGLLVTCDPYSHILDSEDPNTSLLFGDAATATWLGENGRWTLGGSLFQTDGSGGSCLKKNQGVLEMNGRKVFNFAMFQVPLQIKALLEKEQCEVADVGRFYFHQGSAVIVDTIRRRLNLDEEKVPLALATTGNTVSSSIPLALAGDWDTDRSQTIVLSGFGVGLSWASAILYRV